MKTKEVIALALFGVMLAVVATLLIGHSAKGSKKQHTAQIEVIQPIQVDFNQEAKTLLLNQNKDQPVQSFAPQINLGQGLNNTSPFRASD